MSGVEFNGFSLWWIFPLAMIVLCFLVMRGRMGCMMGGCHTHGADISRDETTDSAKDLLDRRYALGEISKEEYEEKKKVLTGKG